MIRRKKYSISIFTLKILGVNFATNCRRKKNSGSKHFEELKNINCLIILELSAEKKTGYLYETSKHSIN